MTNKSINFFFFQAEDGIRDAMVTGVQTCALPISGPALEAEVKPLTELRRVVGSQAQADVRRVRRADHLDGAGVEVAADADGRRCHARSSRRRNTRVSGSETSGA